MERMNAQDVEKFQKALNAAADSLEKSVENLADICVKIFPVGKKTQVANIEQIALAAQRLGDIDAFFMRQTGKDQKKENWARRVDEGECFGSKLLSLTKKVKESADAASSKAEMSEYKNEMRLKLAAVCLRNMHSCYLYKLNMRKG